MRETSGPAWQIREDSDALVLAALHVRDALGVRHAGGVPRLRSAPDGAFEPDVVLTAAWHRWFPVVLDPPLAVYTPAVLDEWQSDSVRGLLLGTIAALSERDQAALRPAVRRVMGDALGRARDDADRYREQRWPSERRGPMRDVDEDLVVPRLVTALAHEAGRRAADFALRVVIAPLADDGVWWLDDATIIVTDSVRLDRSRWGDALEPVLASLV